ncbi:40S ribosomal protein S23-2 [Zea mays]|uniref:40S ribosomal protein S23-2 n=1 Tax=Zea mays TaxID=4577 RepID=A0A1D6NL35_MAIZE|nr:40S ribosomal protein S23-2 [Zea mays]
MGARRKLKTHIRNQRWADKAYKKSHLGNEWKKPFAGSSHAKGIILAKIGFEAKQPNFTIRKCARVQLVKNGKKIAAFVPNDGCLNYIEENVSSISPAHRTLDHGQLYLSRSYDFSPWAYMLTTMLFTKERRITNETYKWYLPLECFDLSKTQFISSKKPSAPRSNGDIGDPQDLKPGIQISKN